MNTSIKLNLIILFQLLKFCTVWSQSFSSTDNYVSLNDFSEQNHGLSEFEIIVAGLPHKMDAKFGLEKVQLTINHPRISDIKVVLVSPYGLEVWLTNRHGKDGSNYTETIFCNSGFRGKISDGIPPFLGEYLPDGELSNYNDGNNPNGIWKVKVYDLKEEISGTFGSIVLYFGNSPAKPIKPKCSVDNPQNCQCKHKTKIKKDYCELLPDLTLIKEITEKELHEIPYNETLGYGELRFGVSTFNKGLGPLEVRGDNIWFCGNDTVPKGTICRDGEYPRQHVYQIIYKKADRQLTYFQKPAGYNAYDARPGHEHFHSDDYVHYELLIPDSIKKINNWKIACKGTKASFCIWDLSYCRDDLDNCRDIDQKLYRVKDLPNYGFRGYKDCLPEVQGLSVGGVDYYGEGFEGQSIQLPKGIKNGLYYLKIEIDPLNLFKESDETNNSFIVPVQISKQSNN